MKTWLRDIRRRGMTLRTRALVSVLTIFLITFIALYFAMVHVIETNQLNVTRDVLKSNASLAAFAIAESRNDPDFQPEVTLSEHARITHSRLTLIDADGAVILDTSDRDAVGGNEADRPEVQDAMVKGYGWDVRTSQTLGERYLYVAVLVPDSDGQVLRLAVPITSVDASASPVLRTMLIAVMVPLVVSLAIVWIASGKLFRPLHNLAGQAMSIAAGNYAVRAPHYNLPDLDIVGSAFNTMAEGLESSIERQQQTSLRLEAVLEGLFDGIVLTDESRQILRMNPVAETMFDVSEVESIGKPFVQIARDYEIARVLNKAFDGKDHATGTVEHGIDRRAIQVVAGVVQGEREKLGLVVLHDVTEIRRLETVRREFVANVSHELRTPLTSIRAMVETLEAGAVEDPEVALDFLTRIVGEIDRLNALLEDLLDFARLESGRTPLRLEYQPIDEVLRHGVARLQEQIERAGLTFEFDLEDDLPEMAVDIGRIEQVILNLLQNAIKFTPPGGTLTIRAWREKNTVYVAVKDTGVGIPEAEQARLFERFYKSDKARRSEGTGLGLAIAQNIVRLHGGRIWVESTPGEGAEFIFTLPMKRKKAAKRARKHTLKGLV